MTFGAAAATHLRNLDDNLSIKPRTRLLMEGDAANPRSAYGLVFHE
jgi:hypothetical protein